MFGINMGELAIIAVIALIVIGPERLPQYAEKLGQLVREGRRMALGLREQVRDEIGPEFDEVDWRQLDPRQYDPRRIVREALKDTFDEPGTTPVRKPPSKPARSGPGPAGSRAASRTAAGTSAGAGTSAPATSEPAGRAAPFDADAT